MSLSTHNANLSSNAKASGKKLSLRVIKNLDVDRSAWLSDVVLKSSLLGTHDTIRTQWSPKDHDHEVKFLGSSVNLTLESKESAEDMKVYLAAGSADPSEKQPDSSSSMKGMKAESSEKQPDSSSSMKGVEAEKHLLATPAKTTQTSHESGGGSSSAKQTSQKVVKRRAKNSSGCVHT